MNRRSFLEFISYLPLVACGIAEGEGRTLAHGISTAPGGKVTQADVDLLVEKRLGEEGVDFASVLETRPKILEREPGLADKLRRMLAEHPDYLAGLHTTRRNGLVRLRTADVEPEVKMLLLDLRLEQVMHEIGTCLEHFLGVFEILREWGHRDAVALVGLFHAVYGTEFNPIQIMDHASEVDRTRLRLAIGEDSERWAYLYAVIDSQDFVGRVKASGTHAGVAKKFFAPRAEERFSEAESSFLAETLVANVYEPYVASRGGEPSFLNRLERFEVLRPLLSAGAVRALELRTARQGA